MSKRRLKAAQESVQNASEVPEHLDIADDDSEEEEEENGRPEEDHSANSQSEVESDSDSQLEFSDGGSFKYDPWMLCDCIACIL